MIKRVRLRDVADRAQVSVSTVSYALNDDSTVSLSEQTRQRIRRIAKEMGYVPNDVARALQGQASHTVGVLLDKPLTLPRYAAIVEGISQGLSDQDVQVALLPTSRGIEQHVADLRRGRMDGLVFIGHDEERVPTRLDEAVRESGMPFVAIDCGDSVHDAPYSTVDFDYATGVAELVDWLSAAGIATVVHVRPGTVSRAERVRAEAMLKAFGEHAGMKLHVVTTPVTEGRLAMIDQSVPDPVDYRLELNGLLQQALRAISHPAHDELAVVCSWGPDTEPAYLAVRGLGWSSPVIGLAASPLHPQLWPGLGHSRLPLVETGREAARLMVGELTEPVQHEHSVLVPILDLPHPMKEH